MGTFKSKVKGFFSNEKVQGVMSTLAAVAVIIVVSAVINTGVKELQGVFENVLHKDEPEIEA